MRITYRNQNIKEYWLDRCTEIASDKTMLNTKIYPSKFSEMVINIDEQNLEAGCGAGGILSFYQERFFKIIGMDYIDLAIKKLKEIYDTLNLFTPDIKNLNFKNDSFDSVLAFGIYHKLKNNLLDSISETYRLLKFKGKVCYSFRPDNIHTRLVDCLASIKKSGRKQKSPNFLKIDLTKRELINLFEKNGFKVNSVYLVENMPILYKFQLFRSKNHKLFDENNDRAECYNLSKVGNLIQKILIKCFPNQFSIIYALFADKL